MSRVSEATAKRLFAVSGNRCAFPKCEASLVDAPSGKIVGRICHINARSPNGPRYDATQSDEERNGFANLILLCSPHHDVVDADDEAYTVDRLLRMKREHEQRWQNDQRPLSNDLAHALINSSVGAITGGSVLSVQHQQGGQVAHSITNVFAPSPDPATSPATQHDIRIFRQADELFGESDADAFFNDLLGGHNYYEHQLAAAQRVTAFLDKITNEYLDGELETLSSTFSRSLEDLLNFIAVKFWIWPEDQDAEDLRFCMYPWGNMDRGWDGSSESEVSYGHLTDELLERVNAASTAFAAYRRRVKHHLFI